MTTLRKKRGNRLSSMAFDEISVVTSPANQHSKIVLWKSADGGPRPTRTMDEQTRELIAKRFAGFDIDSLPDNVAAAMDELVEDNRELAKAVVAAEDQRAELQDELDEAELSDEELVSDLDIAKLDAFGEEAVYLEDDVLDEIEHRTDSVLSKADNGMTREQAMAKVVIDDPELMKAHRVVQLAKAEASKSNQPSLDELEPVEKAMQESARAIADAQLRKTRRDLDHRAEGAEAMAKAVKALQDRRR